MVTDEELARNGVTGCQYNYVVSAQKPTAVTHSAVGNFTSADSLNLILGHCTRIEIHTLTAAGLQGVIDVPIYGRIATLELFRPKGETKDLLFVSTERYKFCVLEYDDSGELITRANGNIEDRVGRPADNGQLGIIDHQCRLIGLHLYDGLFKVIPIDEAGQLHEAFNIRLEELSVIDIKFLYGTRQPVVAVLYQDTKEARHFKTYVVLLKEKDFAEGPLAQQNLDAGANMLIPVPAPLGGVVVIGESVIAYFAEGQAMKVTPIKQTIIRAYGEVDPDGSRYLLGDHTGRLYLLVLVKDQGSVSGLKLEPLGTTSAASTLSYLDNGVVFVGSSYGDSQLIRLSPQPVPGPPGAPATFLEVLETFTNLGPIVDFAVVDLERQGQGQVVTCSGVHADGSLRIVRNGIGMIEQATVELSGMRGIWSLKATSMDAFDTFLVLTFVGETRILAINSDDELDEAEIEGFDSEAQTLYCGNAVHDQLLQVTRASLRLVDAGTRELRREWRPPAGLSIDVAAASASQALLASGDGNLTYVEIVEGDIREKAHLKLDSEIACLDLSPLGAMSPGDKDAAATLAAVGTWGMQLHTFRLPDLKVAANESLGSEAIPRSVLLATFDGAPFLLCALGDGQLYNFHVDADTGQLTEKKRISLGTKPITLKSFRSNGVSHVFAASDRPTVIYSSNKKLLYSNLNEDEVTSMTSFNSSSFPDSLAIVKEGSMTIGTIDEIQRLHIRKVPLHEQPRRIAHQAQTRTLAVLTEVPGYTIGADEPDKCSLRLLDDQTYETVDRLELDPFEQGCSLISISFADDPNAYYAMGSAQVIADEPEPSKGRIVIYQVRENKLHQVCERETKGSVFCLAAFQGKLLAGVSAKVQLYRWAQRDDGSRELVNECNHAGHVYVLYMATRGDFILVGDLMKSMQVLVYKAEDGLLEVRARDYHSNWMTAVACLDEDCYLGAENSYNLFTARKNSDSAVDDERNRLEIVGEYHLGEFVNRFRHGSLVMKLADSDTARLPTLLFGTINGVIGVIASVPQAQFTFLSKLQNALRKVVNGVGGFDHAQWRAFSNERTTNDASGFIDGDLIEQFLDLNRDGMERVAATMGPDTSVEELSRVVEDLSRLH